MGEFPSGQRGQTVNLLRFASMVRIRPPPPQNDQSFRIGLFVRLGIWRADSKGGSWGVSGGHSQPPWLRRSEANPSSST